MNQNESHRAKPDLGNKTFNETLDRTFASLSTSAVLFSLCFFAACGQTTTLPPLQAPTASGNAPNGPNTNAGSDASAGGGDQNGTDGSSGSGSASSCGAAAKVRCPPSTDNNAKLVANYLAGKPITVERMGKSEVCFTNLGSPCKGTYLAGDGTRKTLAPTDACDVNIIDGKIELSLWNSGGALLYSISVTPPESYFPPPTVIEDGSARILINKGC